MEHMEECAESMDSEFILPDLPPDYNDDSNPMDEKDSIELHRLLSPTPRTVDDMDSNIEIKEEVKEEIDESESFVHQTTRSNLFPSKSGELNRKIPRKRKRLKISAKTKRRLDRLRLANETEDQRSKRLENGRIRNHGRRINETEDERSMRLADLRVRTQDRLANETEDQRAIRLADMRQRNCNRIQNETEDQRSARLEKQRARSQDRLKNETDDQRVKRLAGLRNYRYRGEGQRNDLTNESGEEETARLTGAAELVPCGYCEKSLVSRSMEAHILRHHSKAEDKKFKCDHCEKTFAIQTDCKVHMLTHSKEKCFICDKCGKGYKDNGGLKNHVIFKHRYDEDIQKKYWKG